MKAWGSSAGISESPYPGAVGKTAPGTLCLWHSQADSPASGPGEWEQTFRPVLRPHCNCPSPTPVTLGKDGCPKESKELTNAWSGVMGTWVCVRGDLSPQLTVYTAPYPQLFCLPESSCLSSEMATTISASQGHYED